MYQTPNILLFFFCLILVSFGCRTETKSSDKIANSNVIAPEVFNARIRANPDFFNPYQSARAYTNTIVEYAFQKLLARDKKTLELKPVLAKSYPDVQLITEGAHSGGYAITFEILDEAKWDNGTPITGNDFLTTMKIVHNPAGTRLLPLYQEILKFMADIKVDTENPKRFTVYASEPNFKMVENTAWYILPSYVYDSGKVLQKYSFTDFRDASKLAALKSDQNLVQFDSLFSSPTFTSDLKNVIGSGAYQISEWNQNESVTLTKKENWWGEQVLNIRPDFVAYPKSIRFDVIPDETAVIAKIKNNELDVVNTISGTAFEELKGNALVQENYEFKSPETLSMNYLGLNNKNPKLSDARVRKALSCLLDRDEVVDKVYRGHAYPLYGVMVKYDYAVDDNTYAFNIEKARGLLSDAGWEDTNGNGTRDKVLNGERTELILEFLTSPSNRITQQMLLIFQDDFKKAGVGLEQKMLEARQLFTARRKGEFEIFTVGAVLDGSDYELYQYWHTESPNNYYGVGNAKLDGMIERIVGTVDVEEKKKLFIEFQKELIEEQFLIFLTTPKERMLINKRLKDLEITLVRPNFQANTAHL